MKHTTKMEIKWMEQWKKKKPLKTKIDLCHVRLPESADLVRGTDSGNLTWHKSIGLGLLPIDLCQVRLPDFSWGNKMEGGEGRDGTKLMGEKVE